MKEIPKSILLIAAIAFLFISSPIIGLLERMPWSNLDSLLNSKTVKDAIFLSLLVSLSASIIVLILGTPLAWVLVRGKIPGRKILRAVVILPMVLPPVVGGTALLFALGRKGFIGRWLDAWFNLTLPFTTAGAVITAVFVSMPFYVISVESALTSKGQELEKMAETLGVSQMGVFCRVTLPRILPSIGAGLALAWARALGEFGATITFAGNLPGKTQTLPLATFLALETNPEEALALSLLLLTISLAILIPFRNQWLPSR